MPLSTNIFSHEKPHVLTDKVCTISMQLCNMKHGHHQCIDLGWLKILSNPLPSPRMLKILKPILFPLQGYLTWSLYPPCTYTTYIHHNDIININNFLSQWHHQHQHHLISMSSSTPTSFHLNIIINININIISFQYHQHHLKSHSTYIHITHAWDSHFPIFRQHTSHIITNHNTMGWYFKENSKLKRITMVYKTNSYAHLKFNKEVNGRTNIKFWAESPL